MEHLKLDLSSIWIEKDFKDLGVGGCGGVFLSPTV